MKLNPKNRKWMIGGAALLLAATPSFALFGVGDIVFDPQSYASLVSQLTTIKSQFNMLKNNVSLAGAAATVAGPDFTIAAAANAGSFTTS